MGDVIRTARVALSDSIHAGFVFTLCAVVAAVFAALLMRNIWLEEGAAEVTPSGGKGEKDTPVQAPVNPEAKEHYR